MIEEWPEEFTSLKKAADYNRTCRQAIFHAIQKGSLKAEKKLITNQRNSTRYQWVVKRCDLDEYKRSRYNREKRMVDGEKLFDIGLDRWSVRHAALALGAALHLPYHAHRIYYLLRVGSLRGSKKAGAWVISREEILKLYRKESGENDQQMEFASC